MSEPPRAVSLREMGYSAAEFARVLPAAMRDWSVSGGPCAWQVTDRCGAQVATIRIEPLPDRVVGALRLPVLAVALDLADSPSDVRDEFVRRFDRGFHRGGG